MSYNDILGQDDIKTHLKNAVSLGKISHAYLFAGEDGMGKFEMARTFAASLMCEAGGSEMCGECRSCRQAASRNHPDIIYFDPDDAPDNKQAEYTREKIVGDILVRPYQSEYKVYIIQNAHKMREISQNIILKSIEEPPEYVVLILLADKKESMLQTIRSRCVDMTFRPVKKELIESFLMRKCEVPDYRAKEIAAFSFGNPGAAEKAAVDEEFKERKDLISRLLSGIYDRESYEWIPFIDKMLSDDDNLNEYFDLMEDWFRDLLLNKIGASESKLCYDNQVLKIRECAQRVLFSDIDNSLRAVTRARRALAANVDKGLIIFNMLASFSVKDN
ncbi:MAG: DNA polymerase III subunit [Lachnospiraceae bacterium]|nr:DNA polymerase III subunit [Lachnospiraceae bacterium]